MTQAICDITTDEVNVDVVVEPQADTMVEVANRAGGMEQVFHDNTLIGNGNSIDLGVNTDLIATKEYVDEKVESIDTYTKDQIDGKLTAVDAQIDANADAIQKTREDYIQADSEIHQILNNHAENLTTLHNDVDDLGDQVAGIESKIPESASATNQLATKADLANVDLDGYVKKSGDTMTGDLVFDVVAHGYTVAFQDSYANADTGNTDSVIKRITSPHQTQGLIFSETKNGTVDMQFTMIADGFFMPRGNRLLGSADYPWENIYVKKLNNGADITVPTEGGTLARIEDLIDLRADINEADSELQTQITAQAAEIATKQDQLTAGDNIVISGNVISATGAGGGAGFDIVVVQELPATGQKGIIYLLAKDGTAPDVYDEYVWITATQTFELIGTTKVDLSGYLPLAGGTMAGNIEFAQPETGSNTYRIQFYQLSANLMYRLGSDGSGSYRGFGIGVLKRSSGGTYSYGARYAFTVNEFTSYDYDVSLGCSNFKWVNVYTKNLNNGADIAVPTEGGTLARLEDLNTVLPDQTDNAGKFLTTDGSEASWSNKPLVNNNTIGLGIFGNTNEKSSVVIGGYASASQFGCVVIGNNYGSALATNINAVCVGGDTYASGGYSTALGTYAKAQADYAIQLGKGTNSDINTFKVGNNNGNFEMMSADGTIPAERIGNLDFGTMD